MSGLGCWLDLEELHECSKSGRTLRSSVSVVVSVAIRSLAAADIVLHLDDGDLVHRLVLQHQHGSFVCAREL